MSEAKPKLGRPPKKQGTKPTTVSLSTSTRVRLQQLADAAFNGNMTLCVEKMIEWVPNALSSAKARDQRTSRMKPESGDAELDGFRNGERCVEDFK